MNYDICAFYDLDCERFDCSECSLNLDSDDDSDDDSVNVVVD